MKNIKTKLIDKFAHVGAGALFVRLLQFIFSFTSINEATKRIIYIVSVSILAITVEVIDIKRKGWKTLGDSTLDIVSTVLGGLSVIY